MRLRQRGWAPGRAPSIVSGMASPARAPFAIRHRDPRTPPCPRCEDPWLVDRAVPADGLEAELECRACGSRFQAIVGVTCAAAAHAFTGGCCDGFRRYRLAYQDPAAPPGATRVIEFEVWRQDPVHVRAGDQFTLLVSAGARRTRSRPVMPDAVANLTLGEYWPLVAPTCAAR